MFSASNKQSRNKESERFLQRFTFFFFGSDQIFHIFTNCQATFYCFNKLEKRGNVVHTERHRRLRYFCCHSTVRIFSCVYEELFLSLSRLTSTRSKDTEVKAALCSSVERCIKQLHKCSLSYEKNCYIRNVDHRIVIIFHHKIRHCTNRCNSFGIRLANTKYNKLV